VKNLFKIQLKISKFIIAASCFGFGCIAIGGGALAQQPTDADKMKGSLTDLDLSTQHGAHVADERVRAGARRVCAKLRTSADVSTNPHYITCIDEAMANASAQIAEIVGIHADQRPAVAEVPRQLVTYPVGYSDLDVTKLKGAKILYLRIHHAAEALCESAATWGKKEGKECVRKAVDDAVARVDAPLLTQYYELRSKGDRAGLVQLAKTN
jgi:UrcA family protein